MRYAPEHNEATREGILEVVSRLFGGHGIAAVAWRRSVGTVYTHFKSKEALVREALLRSLDARHGALEQALRGGDLEVPVRACLSPEHRDAPGAGSPGPGLAARGGTASPRDTTRAFASHVEPSL